MKRSRLLALPAVVAVAGLSLTACSGGGDTAAQNDDTLTVWVMGDSSANFEELVAPFAEDSGITVDTVAIPWDSIDQKLTTAVASGNGPDVVQIGISKLRTFADSGALLSLDDDTLADYPNLASENFISGVSGDATAIDGEVVSVPWVSDTRVLFYRTDILAESGIDEPPATWDELRADAKTLAGRGDGQYGYYVPQWDSALPVVMTWDHGGDIVNGDGAVDFDTLAFESAVDVYTGLYADGSVPTNSDFDQTQGFTSGVTPMLVSGPYLAAAITEAAPELEGKWSVAPIPGADADTSLLAGSNMGVWGSTDNEEGALRLLDYLSEPETQLTWYGLDGQLPTATAALEDPSLTEDPLVAVYAEQLQDAKILPLVPNWDGDTGKTLLDSLNAIVLNGADRDQTIADLVAATSGTSVN
ncbi:carbohydrate ABC transporter substrate-binding protein (CUT1 family) [Labedella gwakjiensis]|uniref:Carbohydrate ABC transporter substrate-binding protein (CUT1 family) n=1 Tax=Labedella gwakjiensis TaxID=390269 RepID=A0A2P8GTJ8_9MICO|nr:extracellular solute-binding protein [Labedella gwakjiensis]PSL37284.1 carbohydrate ABC transporter substrate-binding protein (CUT1 family) [Labedella gwakjiensis]RUQ84610.1 extracellular solute-binding protein [Labedella gwakjiensis]